MYSELRDTIRAARAIVHGPAHGPPGEQGLSLLKAFARERVETWIFIFVRIGKELP